MWLPWEGGNFSAQAPKKTDDEGLSAWQYAQELGKGFAKQESEWHLASPLKHMTLGSSVSTPSLSFFIDHWMIRMPTSQPSLFKTHGNLPRWVCELQQEGGHHLNFTFRATKWPVRGSKNIHTNVFKTYHPHPKHSLTLGNSLGLPPGRLCVVGLSSRRGIKAAGRLSVHRPEFPARNNPPAGSQGLFAWG